MPAHAPAFERRLELLEDAPCVADQREGSVFQRVELGDVDRDESNVGRGESGVRCAREIAQAGADGEDEVGLAREAVRAGRAGDAHRADRLWMIEGQRAFARLRLAQPACRLRGRTIERVGRFAVEHSASRDDQRALRRANRSRGLGKRDRGPAGSSGWSRPAARRAAAG